MFKLCLCRARNALIRCLRKKKTKDSKNISTVLIRSALFLYGISAVVVYLFYTHRVVQSYRSTLHKRRAATKENHFPRVKGIDCNVFMVPPETWNDSLQNLSEKILPEENFDYDDCMKIKSGGFNILTTQSEKRFPIAFSIIVYKDMSRLTRLLRAVYRPSNVYCVHVDQKSSEEFKTNVAKLTSCFDNVFLPTNQIDIYWGSTGVLDAEMVCLKALWRHQVQWLMFINLTGEEFPLKTNQELVEILKQMNGRNDAWIDPCTVYGPGDWSSKVCTDLSPIGFAERWNNISAAPYNIQPYKGQIHVILSRAAVNYTLHDPRALDLYEWVTKAFIPDELFFSTLNGNPNLGVPGSNPNPRVWKRSIARLKLWWSRDMETWPYCSKYLRSVCLLTARELPLLTTSRQLFANKFKSDYQPLGYSCLEQWYFERVLSQQNLSTLQKIIKVYKRIFKYYNIFV